MQKLIVTVLGIIFVNSLFTVLPSINGSIGGGTLIVYQFYFNSLFLLSFLLKNRISFPQPEKENVLNAFKKLVDNNLNKKEVYYNGHGHGHGMMVKSGAGEEIKN